MAYFISKCGMAERRRNCFDVLDSYLFLSKAENSFFFDRLGCSKAMGALVSVQSAANVVSQMLMHEQQSRASVTPPGFVHDLRMTDAQVSLTGGP